MTAYDHNVKVGQKLAAAVKRREAGRQVLMPLKQGVQAAVATTQRPPSGPPVKKLGPTDAATSHFHRKTLAAKQAQVTPTAPLVQGKPAMAATTSRSKPGAHSTELQRPTPAPAKAVISGNPNPPKPGWSIPEPGGGR